MPLVKSIIQLIDLINEWAGRSVSWLLVIMVLNVFFVVVLRYIFSYGAIWMQELYVWNHSIVFLLGAGYTLLHNGHVRIDLIYSCVCFANVFSLTICSINHKSGSLIAFPN